MPEFLKKILKKGFNSIGFELSNLNSLNVLRNKLTTSQFEITELKVEQDRLLYILLKAGFANKNQLEILRLLNTSVRLAQSKAQISQDLFVLDCLKNKREGFFIEFGATDGVSLSNTYLLEKEYEWNGIVVEPAKNWEQSLKENRNCIIDNRCVWSESGKMLAFNETVNGTLSTLELFNDADYHSEKRKDKKMYQVETISLNDLLRDHNAPSDIDYLSIDTEGSEFEILNTFNFSEFNVNIITVEHNFTARRTDIFNLLISKGYKRVFESISGFDDWYIKDSFLQTRIMGS